VPGVKGPSFVDDIAWWVEGMYDQVVANKLLEDAAVSLDWAADSNAAFDHGKTKWALSHKKKPLQPPPPRWAAITFPSTGKRRAGPESGWIPKSP